MLDKIEKVILKKTIKRKLSELSRTPEPLEKQLKFIENMGRVKLQNFLDNYTNTFELEELKQRNNTIFDYKTAKIVYPEEIPLDKNTNNTQITFTLKSKPLQFLNAGKGYVNVIFENTLDKESIIMSIELSDELQVLAQK